MELITRSLPVGGTIEVTLQREGHPPQKITKHNLITSVGKNLLAGWLAQDGVHTEGITYCALGTVSGTPVVAGTTMFGEHVRVPITVSSVSENIVTLESFFTAASSAAEVFEVGFWGNASAGTALNSGILFEHSSLDIDNSSTAYNITLTYKLSVG